MSNPLTIFLQLANIAAISRGLTKESGTLQPDAEEL